MRLRPPQRVEIGGRRMIVPHKEIICICFESCFYLRAQPVFICVL